MANPPVSNSDLFEVFGGQMNELFHLPPKIWRNIAHSTLHKLREIQTDIEEKIDDFENDSEMQELANRALIGNPQYPLTTLSPEESTMIGEEAWRHIRIFFSDDDLGRLYRDTAVMLDTLPIPPVGTGLAAVAIALDLASMAATVTDIIYSDASGIRKGISCGIAILGLTGIIHPIHDVSTNTIVPLLLNDVKINDLMSKEGIEKISHTNPYINLAFYHLKTKGTDDGYDYPPKIKYFFRRIPSRQPAECYICMAEYNTYER